MAFKKKQENINTNKSTVFKHVHKNAAIVNKNKNSKIKFDDEGNTLDSTAFDGKKKHHKSQHKKHDDLGSKWFEEYQQYNTNDEIVEMKDAEIIELTNNCKTCFEAELVALQKNNPSDAKWLETALHKGTSKDRANAGALLVQSNPLANLTALETLITLSKASNKTSAGAVDIITELFMSALLPKNRKLINLSLRGADFKVLRKELDLPKSIKDKIFAYWHFESELKEHYFEFLRNVQAAIQGNQDVQKNQAIICSSKLLMFSPEKEQMLLSMLVNKLGDPSSKVASKALHHLSEVAYKHPAMCEVITKETEKLLFRNNITEHAQHFALCFLSQIAPKGNTEVCTKLVQICFSFFKIVVQKGAVNSKTMQAILRCLKRAIADADDGDVDSEKSGLLTKEIQDTMYRLVHLADIQISFQTLALLLQIITVRSGKYDRFYNALYRKMLDINLINVGPKAAAQFLHIVHRAVYMDANTARAQAFIKRLLQISFYFPAQITCGCLIVINKLLKSRPELGKTQIVSENVADENTALTAEEDDNAEEYYKDVDENEVEKETMENDNGTDHVGSWHHAKITPEFKKKVNHSSITKYNPYNRVPAFCGAEYALKNELIQLTQHYHPSVQVFAQSIIANKQINFYGDPLKDFCLTQFLERFSFRNPKKLNEKRIESVVHSVHRKPYKAFGGRGVAVKELTKTNCTEDERFIFQYLEQKREKSAMFKKATGQDDNESIASVDDDEFDDYLDKLGGSKKDEEDDELDWMKDLGDELKEEDQSKANKKKLKRKATDDDLNEDNDWDEDGEDDEAEDSADDLGSDDEGSISGENDDDSDLFEDSERSDEEMGSNDNDDDDSEPQSKMAKPMSGKDFRRKLKNTNDMSSLFAAAEDFSEMLEETGKSKTHGTLGDIFNNDKSSEKQLEWDRSRLKSSDSHHYGKSKQKFGGNKKFNNKKRKH